MIKLLVVDDETTTRKGLMKHIPWSTLGISLVEEAKDGIEALEIAENFCPDIVLTDIRMPGQSGVELAEKLRERFPDCKIIFLSGYSDKEYLKAAIHLKALGYVEKPINLTEVKLAVGKAAELCLEEERKRISDQNMTMALTENLPYIRHRMMMNLIEGCNDLEDIKRSAALLKLPFPIGDRNAYYALLLKQNLSSEVPGLMEAMDQCMTEYKGLSAYRDSDHIVILLPIDTVDEVSKIKRIFETLLHRIDEFGFKELQLFCSVGQKVYGIENIIRSYQSALNSVSKIFFHGYNSIVFYQSNSEESYFLDENVHDVFTGLLKELEFDEAIQFIEKLCSRIKQQDGMPVNHVKNLFFKLSFQLFMEAEKRGVYFSDSGDDEEKYLWDLISNFQTLDEIKMYIENKITGVFKRIEELESGSRTVYEVKKYIKQHFFEEALSIKLMADNVYLTPTYLSALFKKETGKTISEYIVEVRIEKSKEYLKDNRLKLFEVAKNVGYSEANYFAKVFKKLTGLTPSEYRERFLT